MQLKMIIELVPTSINSKYFVVFNKWVENEHLQNNYQIIVHFYNM